MRNIFLLSFVLALTPVIFLKPHIGILLWSWVSYMNPHRLSWGFMFDFQFAFLIGGATIVAWLISQERKALPRDPVTILIILISAWISITTIFAIVPAEAYEIWNRTLKILVMTVLAILLMNTRERLHSLIWVIVISIGFFGAKGGLFTLIGGAENLVLGPPQTFLGDNNSLSLALIMTVPLMRYLQLHSALWWVRLGLSGAMLLTLLAIVGTHSRGALLGMAAMLVVLTIKSRKRGLILAAGLVTVVFVLAFTPQHWVERMKSISDYEQDQSVQGRFDAWTFAFKLSLDHPIVGGGFSVGADEGLFFKYVPNAEKVRSFHSIFFEMLGEHGAIGLLIYVVLMITALGLIRRIERRARGRPDLLWAKDLAAMIQVSMVGFLVTGLFQDHAFFDLYYHLLAMIAVMHGLVRRETVPPRAPRAAVHGSTLRAGAPVTERISTPDRGSLGVNRLRPHP